MSAPDCPECGEQLQYEDTFGNLAYALQATGTRPTCGVPQKKGDIYRCETCNESRYTFDGSDVVHLGYPC